MKLRAMIALASAALLTMVLAFGSVAGTGPCATDADSDGVCDSDGSDNCLGTSNAAQRDDDEDGYGNICDADVDQNCVAGGSDVSAAFANLGQAAPWTPKQTGAFDVDENGTVGGSDVSSIFGQLGQAPGPSSRSCADCTAAPATGVCP